MKAIASLFDKLDSGRFNNCVTDLGSLPATLKRVTTTVDQQIKAIDEFIRRAPEQVQAAFRLPFPANVAQNLLVGEDPPMKGSLLSKIRGIESLQVHQALERIEGLAHAL